MKIIGLCGQKGNGKDTFAAYLAEQVEVYPTIMSFADPLKRGAQELYSFEENQLWGDLKESHDERWDTTPRRALQELGDHMRKVSKDHFVKIMRINIEKLHPDTLIVITDVRFPDEADMVRKLGGMVVEVYRPEIVSTDTHASEVRIENPHLVILNDKGLEELKQKAEEFAKQYL